MTSSLLHRPRSALTIKKKVFETENVLLFLLPVLSSFSVNIVGELLVSDILVLGVFTAMLARGKLHMSQPFLKPLLLFWLVWALGAMASDIVNASSARNIARGWMKLWLFAIYLIVIFNLIDGQRERLKFAILGLGLGMMMNYEEALSFDPADGALRTRWKLGFGFGLALWVGVGLQAVLRNRRSSALAMLLLSPINLFLGARSLFLTVFIGSGLSLFSRKIASHKRRALVGMVALALIVLTLVAGQSLYDKAVRTGLFGQETLEKHLVQTRNGGSVLLNARPESMISLRAIAEKPILGHGSWAEDRDYRILYYKLQELSGMQVQWANLLRNDNNLIPSHSMLLGAWVEHGLAGVAFWGFVLSLALRALIQGILGKRPAHVFEQMLIVALIWDIFFSPFGAARRCTEAIFIACAIMIVTINTSPTASNDEDAQARNRNGEP